MKKRTVKKVYLSFNRVECIKEVYNFDRFKVEPGDPFTEWYQVIGYDPNDEALYINHMPPELQLGRPFNYDDYEFISESE